MMRAFTLGIGALALAGLSLPAAAADLGARPIGKAPAMAPAPVLNWTGFYVGVGLGGRWTNTDWTTTCLQPTLDPTCGSNIANAARFNTDNPSAFDMSGFRASAYAGYNWQIGTWVLGIEGDIGWADNTETHNGIPGTHLAAFTAADTAEVRDRWDASIRGRLGFLVTPQALFYVTGGVTWLDKEVTASCNAPSLGAGGWCAITPQSNTFSKTLVGWTVGGGVDWMFAPSWVVRAEYRYADYSGDGLSARFFGVNPIDTFDATIDQKTHTAYVGLSYLFNWSGARY
jgi:outer membrane immunogenic protein